MNGHSTNSNDLNADDPIVHPELHHFVLTFHILCLPFIILPSVFVISAVILLNKLKTPHNYILLAISSSDLLIAVFNIPMYVAVEAMDITDTLVLSHELCQVFHMIARTIDIMTLVYLSLLATDTFFQLFSPLKYRIYISLKRAITCIITLAVFHSSITTVFTIIRIQKKALDCPMKYNQKKLPEVTEAYIAYLGITTGFHMALCFIFGIYTRYKRGKLVEKHSTDRLTVWLTMAYIILYIPTIVMLIKYDKMDASSRHIWHVVARFIRYLSSITNGICVYSFRPIYRYAFNYFIRTNPKNWNKLPNSFSRHMNIRKKTMGPASRRRSSTYYEETTNEFITEDSRNKVDACVTSAPLESLSEPLEDRTATLNGKSSLSCGHSSNSPKDSSD